MRGTRKPSPKKIAEANMRDVEGALYDLYRRMVSHVDFQFTEDMAINTMVRSEDKDFVVRSSKLYGYMRSQYYGNAGLEIIAPSHANDHIFIGYKRHLNFVPPSYLTGRHSIEEFSPDFAEAITPWLEQVVPMRGMYRTAKSAWHQLTQLTDGDYARIRALWPTVDALAGMIGRTVPKLPNPKGLPSPSPELREMLNVAETFVNAAMMMPEKQIETDYPITLQLGNMNL